jgi:hypothetical protein
MRFTALEAGSAGRTGLEARVVPPVLFQEARPDGMGVGRSRWCLRAGRLCKASRHRRHASESWSTGATFTDTWDASACRNHATPREFSADANRAPPPSSLASHGPVPPWGLAEWTCSPRCDATAAEPSSTERSPR